MKSSRCKYAVMMTFVVLSLLIWVMPAGAAERSDDQSMPSVGDMKPMAGETSLSPGSALISGNEPGGSGQGKAARSGSERPMSVEESGKDVKSSPSSHHEFDADMLDHMRKEDEISSVSF